MTIKMLFLICALLDLSLISIWLLHDLWCRLAGLRIK